MVVQSGLPSLEDHPLNQRSTTVAALLRGQIAISEPVPWADSGPSQVLPSPTITAVATPKAEDEQGTVEHGVSQQPVAAPADVSNRPMFRYSDSSKMPSTSTDMQADPYIPPKTSQGPPLRHKRSSLFLKDNDVFLSDSAASSSQRHSTTNESAILTDSTMSPRNPKKRRSGSIKLAWRRIFHKRDKSGSSSISPGRPRGHEYHKSEPALTGPSSRHALRKVTEENFQSRKRLDSGDDYLSRTIIDHPQLPFPMNINAPQPSLYKPSPDLGRENATGSPSPHRRRATLPSIALSPAEASIITDQWMKEEREGELEQSQIRTPSPLIGLAITSNVSQKRRSRSADHLHAIAAQQEFAEIRRRSAEIQYWRSTQSRVPELEENDDTITGLRRDSVQDVKEMLPSISNHSSASRHHLSTSVRHSGSTATTDMEDSRRASKQEAETISRVDQRLSQIEMNMAQLAFSMQTISERETKPVLAPPFKLGKVPRSQRSQQPDHHPRTTSGLPASPRDVGRATSVREVAEGKKPQKPRPSPSYTGLHTQRNTQDVYGYQIPSPPFMQPLGISHSGRDAASASSTSHAQIHNFSTPFPQVYTQIPHSPTQPQSPGNMLEHLAPLYAALRYERTERKRLEALTLQLQHDLLDLTTIVAQRLGYAEGYSSSKAEQVLGGIRKGNRNQSAASRHQQMQHHVMSSSRQEHEQVDEDDEEDDGGEQGWEDAEDDGVGGDEMF